MKRAKFNSSDPVAQFLIDTLGLTTISFVLIVAATGILYGAWIFWRTGSLDWIAWVWRLVVGPMVAAFYLWSSTAMADLIGSLRETDTVMISDDDVSAVVHYYQNPWHKFLSVGIGLVGGIAHFVRRTTDAEFSLLPALISSIGFVVAGYMIGMIALRLLVNVSSLQELFRDKEFDVNPLHPDRAGGLCILSEYSLKTVYAAATVGLMIGLSEYRALIVDPPKEVWVLFLLHSSVPLYVIVAFVSFIAPLRVAHQKMERARDKLLSDIANQFRAEYLEAHRTLDEPPDEFESDLSKIQQLETLHDLTAKFPVWPFDARTVRRFVLSTVAPLLPVIVGVLVEAVFS